MLSDSKKISGSLIRATYLIKQLKRIKNPGNEFQQITNHWHNSLVGICPASLENLLSEMLYGDGKFYFCFEATRLLVLSDMLSDSIKYQDL